jgi:hypothetical protein
MPRLLGKPSKAPTYFGIAFLTILTGAVALEYAGVINVIPGFGKEPAQIIIAPQEAIEKAPIVR